MRKIMMTCCLLLLTLSWGDKAIAQETPKTQETAKLAEPPARFYHLEFVIQELGPDGKPTNSRSFSGTFSTSRNDRGFSIRKGSRIPIVTGMPPGSNPSDKGLQFQYIDVGVNIDARSGHEEGSKLAFYLIAEITNMAGSPGPTGPGDPVIHQNKWQSSVLIPIGKPTVVSTSDSLDSKGGMQLVITATPLN